MKRYRKNFTFSYTIGVFPTLEMLTCRPEQAVKIFISSKGDRNSGLSRIISICQQLAVPYETSDYTISKLSDAQNTYAIGVFNKYESRLVPAENHLVLINPSDRGNLGTIVRTMTAFNVNNLGLISPAVDIFDPKVVRASMGAVFRINYSYYPDFSAYLSEFSHSIYPFMTRAEVSLPQLKFLTPYTLVFGNEGSGLNEEFRTYGPTVGIPQSPGVDSLNLSIAVAVGLYAADRQTAPQ